MSYLFTRLINQLRCWGSYALSIAGVSYVRHMPTFVSVEPANFCQLSCPECPVGMNGTVSIQNAANIESILDNTRTHIGVMTIGDYRKIVRQIAPYAHTIQLFWQGEPLLNDQLPEMVSIAHEAGLYTIISTNAQRLDLTLARALNHAGLNRIIVSMDGWTQSTYEKYRRGGSVDKVKQAVRWLRQAKQESHSRLLIELQCLYLKTNETEWDIFRREYKALGADKLTMKTAQLYDYKHGSPLMPSNQRFSRYKWEKHTQTFVPKRPMRNRCYRLWSGCVIDVHGNMLPCCYDKLRQHSFGNLLQPGITLQDLWHNKRAETFRRAVITNRSAMAICTNCDE